MESDPKRYFNKGMPIEDSLGNGESPLLNISLDATREGSQNEHGVWTLEDWKATAGGVEGQGLYADYTGDKLGGIVEVYRNEKVRELGEEQGIEATEKLETFLRGRAIDNLSARIAKEKRPNIKAVLEDQKHRVEQYHTQEQKKRLERMVERKVKKILG